ncbi:MAG: CvpA family protein [Novosphingobium sp.]
MTGFDIAVLILVGMGAITGFLRGFVQEVLALAAWVLSLVAIHNLHTPMTLFLEKSIGNQASASVLAFAILLLVPYAIVKLLADRLGEVSATRLIGPIDRVIGFGFGAI